MSRSVFGPPEDPRAKELLRQHEEQVQRNLSKVEIRTISNEEYLKEMVEEVRRALYGGSSEDYAEDPRKSFEESPDRDKRPWPARPKWDRPRKTSGWVKWDRTRWKSDR